ncbi:hypothetical protein V3F56_06265 [Moorellaceae bacterium AZ2]
MEAVISRGATCRLESHEQVIEIRNFLGIRLKTRSYYSHSELRFTEYYPPGWYRGQRKPLYEFALDLERIEVIPKDYVGISYFVVRIGGVKYIADVSGGTSPVRGDSRVRQWARDYIPLMRIKPRNIWSAVFDRRHIAELLGAAGVNAEALRPDPAKGELVAGEYRRKKEEEEREKEWNIPLGLVTSAVQCPDGRVFVWTTRGNYYLPPGVYEREWAAGLIPGQSMTIAALRERGIECIPTEERYPVSVYGAGS